MIGKLRIVGYLSALCMCCCISPSEHPLSQKMIMHSQFVRKLAPKPAEMHDIIIAVKQKNLDALHEELMMRSRPNSPNYMKWLTFKEVGNLTSNVGGAEAIINFLKKAHVKITDVTMHKNYIHARATVSTWESVLQAKFFYFENRNQNNQSKSVQSYIRTHRYLVPKEISQHTSHIFNTVQLPPTGVNHRTVQNTKNKIKNTSKNNNKNKDTKRARRTTSMTPHDTDISSLRALYNIPNIQGSTNLTQSLFETNEEYYSPNDLETFQKHYSVTVQPAIPIGGYTTETCSLHSGQGNTCFEANLDIQYMMGISQLTSTKVWHVNSENEDPFLAWILAVADDENPPSVNSISWGADESAVSPSVLEAFNTEAQKLGLMGVTILVSSGDNGATGYGCKQGCDISLPISSTNCVCELSTDSSSSYWSGENRWSGTGYVPKFPASSPYVTVVGGTAGPEIDDVEVAAQSDKNNLITSGGGFSRYYAQPEWQYTAVADYFNSLSVNPVEGYNNQGRGYPDVSIIAVNYAVYIQGTINYLYGTSASTPVFAGMISLINAEREKIGLGTVGFINPTLYSVNNTEKYNDITIGSSNCCSSADSKSAYCCRGGFEARKGWDPVTGHGSVMYDNLLSMFMQ